MPSVADQFPSSDHDTLVCHGVRLDHAEDSIKGIRTDYVSKVENAPTKAIAWGIASIILTGFGVAMVGLVISKFHP